MPQLNRENVRHLLRRTEVVDRPERVEELLALGSIEAAVDNVMTVRATPVPPSFDGIAQDQEWRRGIRLGDHWIDQLATQPRPFAERMAVFWHGHITTSLQKATVDAMVEQTTLFRSRGLGPAGSRHTVADLVKTASIQPAMLGYLDNDQNRASSPNQNFARELMELFLLEVGNYTEADVEAATAAWTGHTKVAWNIDEHIFRNDWHETAPQQFLGRTINAAAPSAAGNETIDVILGTGPLGAGTVPVGRNAGRSSADVAAEFLTRKLRQEFVEADSRGVPAGGGGAMTAALTTTGFQIRPWVRAMLTHDDFYADATKTGLVRQPVEYMVALIVALDLDAIDTVPTWTMRLAGQQLLYPPNVSGWKPNGYWVNASAISARHSMTGSAQWQHLRHTWDGDDGYLQIRPNQLSNPDATGQSPNNTYTPPIPAADFVDLLCEYMKITISEQRRSRILQHIDQNKN